MNIGFDAKRAYHNTTGLGHYSRTLIHSLAEFYPDHNYYLFNPKSSSLFNFTEDNVHEIQPRGFTESLFPSFWRSSWVTQTLKTIKIDLYHGLSHEIPIGIQKTGIKTVVTMHDLIHERFPDQYNRVDVRIYSKKFRFACKYADKIIAISEQTKKDLVDIYQTPAGKIEVCYQSCNPDFGEQVGEADRRLTKAKYRLPDQFFLYVGSIIERKNLLNICKAMFLLRNENNIPLVVIGDGDKYKAQVKDYVRQNSLNDRIIFLSDTKMAKESKSFQTAIDFPAIYQSAVAMIYPSFFEGFGIPVLEALWSRLPVITSNVSSLPEAGGEGAYYVNPHSAEEIAAGMKKILQDQQFADQMKEKGWQHAQKFTREKCADNVMKVYEQVMDKR